MNASLVRTRWAAIGATVAISLGGGGVGITTALTDSGPKPVFVPIEPCRLADMRPDTIGPDGTVTFDGWGTTGECDLPAGAAGLALNVTAVNATQQTNLRFFPAGSAVPGTANLNPTPGAPPTPNAVNVTLDDAEGRFSVFNRFGDVSVVIDVMGYYDDHHHDDRYYTETEIDERIDVVTVADGCEGIQAALDGLPAGGGEIVVGAGTFECAEPVVIDRDDVTLRGSGPSTTLSLADGANSPLLIVGDTSDPPAVAHHHVRVSDLRLDGNSATQPDECWGGPCTGPNFRLIRNNTLTIRRATDVLVEDVVARDARSGGLVIELDSRRITVRGFESSEHVFDGLAAYLTEDSTFTDLKLYDNAAAGLSFDTDFDNNLVSGAVITGSGTDGIFMRDSHDNLFADIQIRGSTGNGVFIAQDGADTSTAATGNTFDGLLVEGSGADGIHIANPSNVDNLLDDIQFAGNTGACLASSAPVVLGENICR